MPYDPMRHHRHSIRYPRFDYATANAYFITICIQDRACVLGDVVEGEILPSIAGSMVESWWNQVPYAFPSTNLDAYVVMPNHVHGVVVIGAEPHLFPASGGQIAEPSGPSLPKIVQWFKTMTTNDYIDGVHHHGLLPFRNRLWQRNYHDRIIRNDGELDRIRAYIEGNPASWLQDDDHPANVPVPSASLRHRLPMR